MDGRCVNLYSGKAPEDHRKANERIQYDLHACFESKGTPSRRRLGLRARGKCRHHGRHSFQCGVGPGPVESRPGCRSVSRRFPGRGSCTCCSCCTCRANVSTGSGADRRRAVSVSGFSLPAPSTPIWPVSLPCRTRSQCSTPVGNGGLLGKRRGKGDHQRGSPVWHLGLERDRLSNVLGHVAS